MRDIYRKYMKNAIIKELNLLFSQPREYYFDKIKFQFNNFDFKLYNQVILFGAKNMGMMYVDFCKQNSIEVLAFCDNDKAKQGGKLKGISVISPDQLKKIYSQGIPIIITSVHEEEIKSQLTGLGFKNVWSFRYFAIFYPNRFKNPHWINSIDYILNNKNKILEVVALLKDDQSLKTYLNVLKYRLFLNRNFLKEVLAPLDLEYFDKNIVNLTDNEVFIDGGAFTGDTMIGFIKATHKSFKNIIAFEPDAKNYKELEKTRISLHNRKISVHKLGLGEKTGIVSFSSDGTAASMIEKGGITNIKLIDLDSFLEKEKIIPSIIKLDIEGAEKEALIGAKQIIKNYRPKLAICIYHKPSHLWELPLLINKFNKNYKFYIRHYTDVIYDSVCYAV